MARHNPNRYAPNWPQLSLEIRQAAQWQCQDCQRPCRRPDESVADLAARLWGTRWLGDLYEGSTAYPQRFVLTTAHLDQDPGNNDPANLRALCSVCHLRFDSHFKGTQRRLLAEFNGQLNLDSPTSSGLQLSLLPGRVAPFDLPHKGPAPVEGRALHKPPRPCWVQREGEWIAAEATGEEFIVGDARLVAVDLPSGRQLFAHERVAWSIPTALAASDRRSGGRRHRPKGQASGWIEERLGNRGRTNPSVSYYYRWDSPKGRVSEYIRAGLLERVERMIAEQRPALEILRVVAEGKRKISGVAVELLG